MKLDILIFGLSITSTWANGHAGTYRALTKALHRRGHRVRFLERDVPWYRDNCDLAAADYCDIGLYGSLREVAQRFGEAMRRADLVILGSYVPDGARLGDWITSQSRGVTAFYDIDTPVTLAGLNSGQAFYITPALVPRFDLYLSFTGGPTLRLIEDAYGSPRARVLNCAAELSDSAPFDSPERWALGYIGTYSADRHTAMERLLFETARRLSGERFVVAGSQYPAELKWPGNVERIEHLPQRAHAGFYGRQRYTLNLTREDMRLAGYSPSVRLFEAAACGTPVITDSWPGLETFFAPGREILIVEHADQIVQVLIQVPEERRREIAIAARQRLLLNHTPDHRARQLEDYYREVLAERPTARRLEVVA